MKRYAFCLLALLGASAARADDLFYEDGAKAVNRTLIIGNVIYEQVQIVGRVPGGQVELKVKGGRNLVVPEKRVPPLWSSAMDKREGQRRISAQRGIDPAGNAIGAVNITGREKTEVKSLSNRAFEMRALADERCYAPCSVTKADGTMMQGVLLGFRGRRSEVLFSNYYAVAWVGMYYFHPATADRLSMMDIKEQEGENGGKTDEIIEQVKDTPPKAPERDPEVRLVDIMTHGPDYNPEPPSAESPNPPVVMTREQREIRDRAAKIWPRDYKMQLKEVERQEEACQRITQWSGTPPSGLSKTEWEEIWLRARRDWPGNYRMQVQEIQEQMEALAALKRSGPQASNGAR
ncbi:MAG: hypothetical protein EOP86_05805 [Verrucomicrobiaceae bacterium]|nr:MAG: hypothetical protein EOP86_05805 [Verrucomicrobiaceae bacterium]